MKIKSIFVSSYEMFWYLTVHSLILELRNVTWTFLGIDMGLVIVELRFLYSKRVNEFRIKDNLTDINIIIFRVSKGLRTDLINSDRS